MVNGIMEFGKGNHDLKQEGMSFLINRRTNSLVCISKNGVGTTDLINLKFEELAELNEVIEENGGK